MKGVSLVAAVAGQARWSAYVVPTAAVPGESSRAMNTAAATFMPPHPWPGTGRGDWRDRRHGVSACHPLGDAPRHDFA